MKLLISVLFILGATVESHAQNSNIQELIRAANHQAAMYYDDGDNIQGSYIARFETLNSHVVGSIPGAAHIRRHEKKINAFVRLFAGSPSAAHFQNVHMGTRCPTLADDRNFDGYLDYEEVIAVVGPVVIPLDEELKSQSDGNRIWPKAFENGSYDYLKEAKFKKLWKDLKERDKDPNDNITKIFPGQGLALTGKVIVILGVGADRTFPATVKPRSRYKVWQTFPIVCGQFLPVFHTPGVPYQDRIPGPIAAVEPGQDRPAPAAPSDVNPSGVPGRYRPDDRNDRNDRRERDPEGNIRWRWDEWPEN